jgi:hypothetical protein
MNNRLKRLAERSFWDEQAQQDMEDFIDLEKFAELIIRECAEIAMREDHDPAECIKRHFGVKE